MTKGGSLAASSLKALSTMARSPPLKNRGSIRSFVFRVGLLFFVWLRFRQGAIAPSSSPRAAGLWGRAAPIPKAPASFIKSLPKLDGKLVGRHPPGQRWICPRFGDVAQGQIDELRGRFVAGEVPSILEHLAQLHMQTFNRIGGVDDLSHLRRITVKGSDLFPISAPALGLSSDTFCPTGRRRIR